MDETISRLKIGTIGILATILSILIYNTAIAGVNMPEPIHDIPKPGIELFNRMDEFNNSSDIEIMDEVHEDSMQGDIEYRDIIDYIYYDIPLDIDLQTHINVLCKEYNVPYSIVISLIYHESTYKADVISSTNDYGLMQINKVNHGWISADLGISNFLNPYENCHAGIYMLSILFDKYDNPHLVLMAYNFGEGRARQLWASGVFSSKYSDKVVNYSNRLEMGEV